MSNDQREALESNEALEPNEALDPKNIVEVEEPSIANLTSPAPTTGLAAPPDAAAEYAATLAALTPKIWLTQVLVAINVLIFVAMIATGVSPTSPTVDSLITWGANFGPRTTGGQWWRLLSSMFIHIGLIHIAMNMWVLFDIGRFMEKLLGRGGFLVMYVFAGLAGSIASVAWNPFMVSAGASGAVFGLYGGLLAYLLRLRNRIPTNALAGLQRGAVTFIGYNVLFGFTQKDVDVSAHFGGLAGGFLIGLVLSHAPTAEAAASRPRRAIGGALAGAAIVCALALSLPKTPDLDAAFKQFAAVEKQVLDVYNGAVTDTQAGKLDDEACADVIEKQVLVPWRAAREPMAKMPRLPKRQQEVLDKMLRYQEMRAGAWQQIASALREHDEDGVGKGTESLKASMEILK